MYINNQCGCQTNGNGLALSLSLVLSSFQEFSSKIVGQFYPKEIEEDLLLEHRKHSELVIPR